MLFALVAVVLAQVPDPAADLPPPPPLLDDPVDDSAPPPIEPVPTPDPDADLPPLETPDAHPNEPNAHPDAKADAKNADWILLGIDYLVIFVPIPFGGLVFPILQGLVHLLAAETLVHNTYPYWWAGVLAGYGVYALGGALVVGGYVTVLVGVFGAGAGVSGGNTALVLGALLGGIAMIALGVAVNFLEPLAAYFVGTWGGQPVGKSAKSTGDEDEDPDVGIPASLALTRSLGVQP